MTNVIINLIDTVTNMIEDSINEILKHINKQDLLDYIKEIKADKQMIEKTITSKNKVTKDYIYADTTRLLKLIKEYDTENRLNAITVSDKLISDFTTFSFSSDTDSYEDLVVELVKVLYNTEATRFTFSNSNKVFSKIDNKNYLYVVIKLEKYTTEVVNI